MITIKKYRRTVVFLTSLGVLGCASTHQKPCSEGGQPAREGNTSFKGIKKCFQKKDKSGVYVNDGKYMEWYNSDNIALVGEYKMGKKTGRWTEYDEKRNVISDKWFEDGKEVPHP